MKSQKKFAVFLILVLTALTAFGCAQNAKPATDSDNPATAEVIKPDLEQEPAQALEKKYFRVDNGESGVTVEALWLTSDYLKAALLEDQELNKLVKENIVFEIFMSTHGGNLLDEYDVLNNAELVIDGRTVEPYKWQLNQQDSHHPAGSLIFANVKDGERLLTEDTKSLTLVVKNLRKVPARILTWQLPIQ